MEKRIHKLRITLILRMQSNKPFLLLPGDLSKRALRINWSQVVVVERANVPSGNWTPFCFMGMFYKGPWTSLASVSAAHSFTFIHAFFFYCEIMMKNIIIKVELKLQVRKMSAKKTSLLYYFKTVTGACIVFLGFIPTPVASYSWKKKKPHCITLCNFSFYLI